MGGEANTIILEGLMLQSLFIVRAYTHCFHDAMPLPASPPAPPQEFLFQSSSTFQPNIWFQVHSMFGSVLIYMLLGTIHPYPPQICAIELHYIQASIERLD